MGFLLSLIFAGALIYLWRKFDALEAQIQRLDQYVDSLQLQLSRNAIETATPARKVVTAQERSAQPTQPESTLLDDEPIEKEAEARPTSTAIPASRKEPLEVMASEPVETPELPEAPEVEPHIEEPARTRFQFDFEDFFGRLLPIWAGGIALAVAGFFLVRYSIEQGLLGPQVRVALGFLFGGILLGGAEIAYRQEHRISDPRVRQALAGAGLATLYASFYLAGSQYGLIGSAIAFLGLAGVTGAAILLSFRFGLPSAILGLVGGFAAPMLVASENPNLPILALYLALVTGGLTYAGNRQGRSWLALAALAGGLGWGMLMLFSGVTGYTDILAFGGYIVVLGAILPAFAKAGNDEGIAASRFVRLGAAGLAAIQMGLMVGQTGFSLLAWSLFGLLAAALAFFAWSEPRLREASAFASAVGLAMLGIWPDPSIQNFTIVGVALLAIFGAVPLANIWRGAHRDMDAYQLAGFALGLIAITPERLHWAVTDLALAGIALAITTLPILATWKQWPSRENPLGTSTLVTLTSAVIGIVVAGLISTPLWASPLVIGGVALGVIALGWHRNQKGLTALAWITSVTAILAMAALGAFADELDLLIGRDDDVDVARALLRWTAIALPFIALAIKKTSITESIAAQILASLLVYGIAAQIVPGNVLAWTAAGLSILTGFIALNASSARFTFGFVAIVWSLEPVLIWILGAVGSAIGVQPMLIADEIGLSQIGLRMLPVFAVALSLILRPADTLRGKLAGIVVPAGMIGVIAAHITFKHVFALESSQQFVELGLAERTIWQGLLLAAGLGVAKFVTEPSWSKPVRVALFGGALAHFVLFTLIWHNPLWDEQAVGGIPLINLLLPAYGIAICATVMLKRLLAGLDVVPSWLYNSILMGLISLLALSELRHLFAGSIFIASPVGSTEDLLRSVLGIVLAIGFLMWGARADSRSWRVGSLVLMLAAVLKVFIFDASALDGLLRVASFIALGLSLIGIGWFYTRQLAGARRSA